MPHHLAGRAHFRPEHGVDAGEAGEGKHRFLDPDMIELLELEIERSELFARHDAGGDRGDRLADHLGDERHRARGARVDLEHVDLAAFERVLHVHEPADFERARKLLRLLLEAQRSSRA